MAVSVIAVQIYIPSLTFSSIKYRSGKSQIEGRQGRWQGRD